MPTFKSFTVASFVFASAARYVIEPLFSFSYAALFVGALCLDECPRCVDELLSSRGGFRRKLTVAGSRLDQLVEGREARRQLGSALG
ncbi:MAG: hypothetical protein ACRDNP_08555 [Gaiellaceae bacterium]